MHTTITKIVITGLIIFGAMVLGLWIFLDDGISREEAIIKCRKDADLSGTSCSDIELYSILEPQSPSIDPETWIVTFRLAGPSGQEEIFEIVLGYNGELVSSERR